MIEILLVEDDDGDILMVEELLEEMDFQCRLHIAHNGEDALAFLKDPNSPKVEFIISDINMPRMDGHEFLMALSQEEELKNVPVAVLTSAEDSEVFMKTYDMNAIVCMSKPLDRIKVNEILTGIERSWAKGASTTS